jgi:2-aminoethylphosphonate dioxygenase
MKCNEYFEYKDKGFFILKNVFDQDFMETVFDEIISSKEAIHYYDRKNKLRRIEQIYNKGSSLIELNNKILNILSDLFDEKFIIFKDKYNAKPPGGEGFFAHYDGIFLWEDSDGSINNGWHIYAENFVNVLVSIDPMDETNGQLEIAKVHDESFGNLLNKTKKNGTPDLSEEIEQSLKFEKINLLTGDVVFFSSKCPHKSSKNNSKNDRRTIYYTYNKISEGDNYELYFRDKMSSKNKKSKSLSGEI